jgi:hypothetical protein
MKMTIEDWMPPPGPAYEKYVRDEDGYVAVLISPGSGFGWSTEAETDAVAEALAFDREFVEIVLNRGIPSYDRCDRLRAVVTAPSRGDETVLAGVELVAV